MPRSPTNLMNPEARRAAKSRSRSRSRTRKHPKGMELTRTVHAPLISEARAALYESIRANQAKAAAAAARPVFGRGPGAAEPSSNARDKYLKSIGLKGGRRTRRI